MLRKFLLATLIAIFVTGLVAPAHAQLAISEFLAGNSNSILDEEGNHEDWLEIQNTSPDTATSTLGWYLTDDASKPRKWAFPSRTIPAQGYLVVFASSKNRRPASGNLHTNFKLNASASYLALNKDAPGGGVLTAQAFDPYPQQATDIAYGTTSSITTTSLVSAGAAVKALVPSADLLGSTWRGAAENEPFADGDWIAGTTGVGFGDSSQPVGMASLKQRLNPASSGTIATDTSGNGHTATNNGVSYITSNTDAATTPRTRGGVMQFVAAENDQLIIPAQTDFDQALCTVSLWMRSAGLTGSGSEAAMLWDRRANNGGGPGTLFAQHSNGKIYFQAAGGVCTFSSTASVSDDRWHHIVLSMNTVAGGTSTIYVDGVNSGSGTNSSAWGWSPTQAIAIGRSPDTYWYKYNGLLDDIRFYNRQLTASEVAQLYAGGDEPMAASDIGLNVQAQMLNVNSSIYTRVPFTIVNPAAVATLRLSVRSNDGFVAYVNGTQIAAQNAPASPAYNDAATGSHGGSSVDVFSYAVPAGLLRTGANILAIQGLNSSVSDTNFLLLPKLEGISARMTVTGYMTTATPAAANSAIRTNVGPFISAVTKDPDPRPLGTASSPPLVITAKVMTSLRPLAATNPVQLKYLVMFGAEQTVAMTPTATAGVYTAPIPTSSLGPGQMLRWRIVATDSAGAFGTAPEYSDPADNERYYGTVALDSTIESTLPIFYWFTPNAAAADDPTGTRNSFFYKAPGSTSVGRFYDNVSINIHGQTSQGFPKKSHDLNFNQDNRFEWSGAGKRVKGINLLTNYGDKSMTHNTMTHELLATVGSVHHWCYPVRVQQVTPSNASSAANQFWGIADMMENGDDDFLERNGLDPDGALYKMYDSLASSGSAEKKTREFEGSTDLDALITGLDVGNTLAVRRRFAYDNLNLPQCVSYFVGLILASSQDNGHKNFYMYRDTPGSREWSIFPWDVDLTWGRNWLDASGYFTDTIYTNNRLDLYNDPQQGKGENRLYNLIVGNSDQSRVPAPEFRDMVLRRLRTVLDGYFSAPGVLEERFAQLANLLDPQAIGTSDADRDLTKWGSWGTTGGATGGLATRYHIDQILKVYLPGRRTFLNTATLAGAPVPSSQPATAANLITIETIDFNPSTKNQAHEFFVLRNANTFSVDLSGWQITGALSYTFPAGTVIPPGGGKTENLGDLYVARDPLSFRQRTIIPDDGLSGSNQYRYVVGPYKKSLSARGGTIELRDNMGTLVRAKSWNPAPTASQSQLRLSELNYSPVAPTAAESGALSGVTASDFEYIELANTGVTALPLTGSSFDQGVTFTFPAFSLAPGGRCLIVANTAAFQLRYGHSLDALIVGQFEGNLDNGGESLRLLDNVGEVVLDFTYDNKWWPPSDAGGRTLVVKDLASSPTSYDLPQNWALSGQEKGTPGAVDLDFAAYFDGWRYSYFTSAEIPTTSNPDRPGALTLDPDGDGMNNLEEYAFGLNPKVPEGGPELSYTVVNDGGTDYLALTFNRRHKALDLTYTVEASNDLLNWSAVTTSVGAIIDLGNGMEQVTFRDSQTYSAQGARYMHVRVAK